MLNRLPSKSALKASIMNTANGFRLSDKISNGFRTTTTGMVYGFKNLQKSWFLQSPTNAAETEPGSKRSKGVTDEDGLEK
jgi:hypothetical protein